MRRLVQTATVMAGVMLTAAAAEASGPKVTTAGLDLSSTGEIIAVADDGKNYNRLETSNLTFSGYVGARVNRGYIRNYYIYSGGCRDGLCGTGAFKELHRAGHSSRLLSNNNLSFTFSTDNFPQKLSANVQAEAIFKDCNARTNNGRKNAAPFMRAVMVTLGIETDIKATGFDHDFRPDYTKSFMVPVSIKCQRTANGFPTQSIDMDVKLRVKALEGGCLQNTEVRTKNYMNVPGTEAA